jgi:F-type H+-transporting ATPase subunit h
MTADLIQDLYLRELKAYKPPPQKGPEEGAVAKFSPPAAPKSPEEADLASEMSEYENSTVEIEGSSTGAGETQEASADDYFEDLKQIDEEDKGTAHH